MTTFLMTEGMRRAINRTDCIVLHDDKCGIFVCFEELKPKVVCVSHCLSYVVTTSGGFLTSCVTKKISKVNMIDKVVHRQQTAQQQPKYLTLH